MVFAAGAKEDLAVGELGQWMAGLSDQAAQQHRQHAAELADKAAKVRALLTELGTIMRRYGAPEVTIYQRLYNEWRDEVEVGSGWDVGWPVFFEIAVVTQRYAYSRG
jgi:hypothetical protein